MSALLESLAEISAQLPPERRAEFESAQATGLPSQRNERWKYTSLRALSARRFIADTGSAIESIDPSLLASIEGPRLVFVNGEYAPDLSIVAGNSELRLEFEPNWKWRSQAQFHGVDEVFASLNLALERGGAHCCVWDGAKVTTPVHIVFVGTPRSGDIATHLRHEIGVGAGSSLVLVEHHIGVGQHRNLDNHLVQVELAKGARLLHVRVQDGSDGATLIARTDAGLDEDAQYRRIDLELGSALSRHELNVGLAGRNARFLSSGALLAGGRRHVDTRLGVRHVVGETSCELLWRGLAAERGKLSFHGGIEIEAGADGSDASLSNKNLLLSPNAEIDTQPVLLIHADEVKAAHGATVGRLDERSLFYLQSRGIPAAQARVMLTLAFLREVLAAADAPELVEALSPRLDARLATLEALA